MVHIFLGSAKCTRQNVNSKIDSIDNENKDILETVILPQCCSCQRRVRKRRSLTVIDKEDCQSNGVNNRGNCEREPVEKENPLLQTLWLCNLKKINPRVRSQLLAFMFHIVVIEEEKNTSLPSPLGFHFLISLSAI